ncbi:MAG: NAD(+) synthase [Candidatus Coatesbacteria bacterium]|nr:NAD(+) synthase [Candidatus Coatesbacteria bacterium]
MKEIIGSIQTFMANALKDSGSNGFVLGMSGGIDSSVAAVLAKQVAPSSTLGLILPCESNLKDREDALLVAENFDIETIVIDIKDFYKSILRLMEHDNVPENKLTANNLKPRLRMIVLYYWANRRRYLVIGTGNKVELQLGYYTKYGDGGCDIMPLGDLYKSEVYAIAKELDIPKSIIEKQPSAGLWHGQTDEGEIGLNYADMEHALKYLNKERADKPSDMILDRIHDLIKRNGHKAHMPKIAYVNL